MPSSLFEQADSQMGYIGIALMVQTMLAQAHPLAFPETSPEPGVVRLGPVLNALNVLDTLQECPVASPAH